MLDKGEGLFEALNIRAPLMLGFRPEAGTVLSLALPAGEGLRIDHDLDVGIGSRSDVDSMVAKLIAYGKDRTGALGRLRQLMTGFRLLGVIHNLAYLKQLIQQEGFAEGRATTKWAETLTLEPEVPSESIALMALMQWHQQSKTPSTWLGLRTGVPSATPFHLQVWQQEYQGTISRHNPNGFTVRISDQSWTISPPEPQAEHQWRANIEGLEQTFAFIQHQNHLWLHHQGRQLCAEDIHQRPAEIASNEQDNAVVKAPMNGAITKVLIETGATVAPGDTMMILEAMKMQHEIKSRTHGTIASILVKSGQNVRLHQPMVAFSQGAPT